MARLGKKLIKLEIGIGLSYVKSILVWCMVIVRVGDR